ncbi:MAG: hypothetical protein KJO75_18110, partial [Dactylosporangium sp.]|nr:hypothetical protein [Dactylosporangium sp.]
SRTARSRSSVGYFFGAAMDDLHRAYRHVIRDLQENGGNSEVDERVPWAQSAADPGGEVGLPHAEQVQVALDDVRGQQRETRTNWLG